ncbi:hypothetical protein [Bradyrhizobium sp. Cp5.3]|uniref:hypothetical protein n=1 Tax=Bradyrhizobium sp. Cp5.3 TaxID=443598 RepID=UPI0018DEA9ED|nr:hypothetical protein [Bradyrhizobium sp. Cp5.3]
MRGWLAVLLAAVLGAASIRCAIAEDYSARPVTMIVPFPAGRATDTLARFLGERLHAVLKQPIVVEMSAVRPARSASAVPCAPRPTATRCRLEPRPRTC